MHPILIGKHETQCAVRIDDIETLNRDLIEFLGRVALRHRRGGEEKQEKERTGCIHLQQANLTTKPYRHGNTPRGIEFSLLYACSFSFGTNPPGITLVLEKEQRRTLCQRDTHSAARRCMMPWTNYHGPGF